MDRLGVRFLGRPCVQLQGEWRAPNLRPQTLPLFAFVLLSPEHAADVRDIANNLWPDDLDEDARSNVRRHLYYLRQWLATLGFDPEGIERTGRTVRIAENIASCTDLAQFERFARDASTYARAIDCYSGDLLEGFEGEWIASKREALRERFLEIVDAHLEHARDTTLARRALAMDPWRETTMRALMRILEASGDRAGALSEYQRFVRVLRADLGAEPSEATIALADSLSARLAGPRNALPRTVTSFVGREREIAELSSRCMHDPAVTITGTAGVGKTRLSIEVARRLESHFADGVRFIELAPLQDERAVTDAVHRALVSDDAFVPGDATAFEAAIRNRALLVVLDNCEHVGAAAAAIVRRIVAVSPASRVLATSRLPLQVGGEVTWRLEPLDVDAHAPRLLLDRIHAARPEIDPKRLPRIDIERICHALDGIPLAIELTAARLRTMSLREIADQLAGHMDTMAQALRWSVDLLSDEERRIFYRLSAFRDGFDTESVRAICGADAARHIAKLVDASLIVPPQPDATDERYRVLESVRQLAAAGLQETGDADAAHAAHAQYFAARFIALDEDLRHARSNVYFNLLERDYQNVRAALEWLLGGAGPETGINLALAISRYWFDRGLAQEARTWMERALRLENVDALLRARVLQCLATVCRNSGDYAEHFALIGQAVEELRAGGADAATIGKALAVQSNGARILGDFEHSRRLAAESAQMFAPLGDPYLLAFAHTCVAVTLYSEGRLDEAEVEFAKIFDEFEACRAENDATLTLVNLGICRLYAGDYDVALARLTAALPRALALKHRYAEAWTRLALAMVLALRCERSAAFAELPRAVQLARGIDDKEQQINCVETAAILWADEDARVAAQALSCAERARERFHVPRLPVELALHGRVRASISTALDAPALAIASEEGRFTPLDVWLDRIERGQYSVQVGVPSQKSTS